MSNSWPMVPLGEVLTKSEKWVNINPEETYKEVTVRLWGKGVGLRREVGGAEIAASRRLRVKAEQFILSRIDARNGAFGLVPDSLDGAVVSNDFPVFSPNPSRILPSFLNWMSKTRGFVDICKAASEGTTNRVRLQENRFLTMEVSLPSLSEQRRIVARIEELAAKIEEARSLRRRVVEEVEALWPSILLQAFKPSINGRTYKEKAAVDLLKEQAEAYLSAPKPNHNNAHSWKPNIYSKGPYVVPSHWAWTDLGSVLTHLVDCVNDTPDFSTSPTGLLGLKSTNIRPYRLDLSQQWFMTHEDFARWNRREKPQAGDIILTREAPMGNACVLPDGIQACLTQRLMLLRTDERFVRKHYLLHYLNSPCFHDQVLDQCRGLTTPHIRVQDAPFIKIPLAPVTEQDQIVSSLHGLQSKANLIKQVQTETAVELDAMLPSILDKAFKGDLL